MRREFEKRYEAAKPDVIQYCDRLNTELGNSKQKIGDSKDE